MSARASIWAALLLAIFAAPSPLRATTPRAGRLFDAYWVQPMVENAWKEARGIPILQGEGLPAPPAPPARSHTARRGAHSGARA